MSDVIENINDAPDGFFEDDFVLRGNGEQTKIDSNFASMGYWKEVRARFFSNKGAVFSLAVILIIVFFAFIGPKMTEYTYSTQNLSQKNYAPRIPGFDDMPVFNGNEKLNMTTGSKIINGYKKNGDTGVYYWFGSDVLGRDIWTRTWMGTRVSLYIAIVAVLIDVIIGLSYGLVSGYFGGMIDSVMQRFAEIVNGIPRLVIVTLLMLVLKPGIATIIFALMITEWIGMSRIARA
ncbi:MAG: ABC transporter permease, partial [Treponema sp.]